jgi:HipA-like protein
MKMIGDKQVLDVYQGEYQIAHITLIEDQLYWSYNANWQKTGYAVSPHLALYEDIPPLNVQRFLRNLLPEGNPLEVLVNIFHLRYYYAEKDHSITLGYYPTMRALAKLERLTKRFLSFGNQALILKLI